jgi:hypothetical protein
MISSAISFPQCYVTFMFQFFKFYLSPLPSLPPISLSEHSLSVSFLGLPFFAVSWLNMTSGLLKVPKGKNGGEICL